jgi:hypothetical protein
LGDKKLNSNNYVKTIEDVVFYWMEAVHITNKLQALSVYSDEANYANIVATIDGATDQVSSLVSNAEDMLGAAIESAIAEGKGDFVKYKDKDISSKMSDLTSMLQSRASDISGSSRKEQMESFNKVLFGCMDKICSAA